MSVYQKHLFLCTNKRDDGTRCCGDHQASELFRHLKNRTKEAGLFGIGQIRINKSGCLGLCALGPVLVVYPDNVWYRFSSTDDLDEIFDQHLVKGEPVKHLQISQ